jgi:flagellar assembly protein FliH
MSTDSVVLRDLPVDAVTSADTSADLRGGVWTRLGGNGIRGDQATETTLSGLAERSREVARAQGFAAGWAEGRRGSLARSTAAQDEQLHAFEERSRLVVAAQQSAADAVARAATSFQEMTRTVHAELADAAVELALQIAETVLGRELVAVDDAAADAVRRALTSVPVDVPVVVRLHPADLAALDAAVSSDREVTYLADPALGHGDAVVETDSGSVDAGIGAALARVREVLGR